MRTKPTTEEMQANRDAKLESAKAMLVNAVATLQTSDGWGKMLKAMAAVGKLGLRRLSFRNQLLVMVQRPTAHRVGTFKAWITQGRVVQKGEKAITILAPVIVKDREAKQANGDPASKLIGFRPHNVFAQDQTAILPGRTETPEADIKDFVRNVEDDSAFTATIDTLRGFALASLADSVSGIDLRPRQAEDPAKAAGWFVPSTKRIVVITGEAPHVQTCKTLIHEIAHATLGHGGEDRGGYSQNEIEAESTAYLVCSQLGIDSGCYSFGYIGSWAGGEDGAKLILASGTRIVKAANAILDAFDPKGASEESEDLQEAA